MHTNIRNHTVTKNNMNSMTSSWFYRFINERSEFITVVLSALTLLVGCQEEHLACKKLSNEVLVWLSVWIEVQIVCIWSSWCHCHLNTPSSLASFKSRLVLPFWYHCDKCSHYFDLNELFPVQFGQQINQVQLARLLFNCCLNRALCKTILPGHSPHVKMFKCPSVVK